MIPALKILLIVGSILTNFFFALAVWLRNIRDKKNILFALISALFAVWGTCLLLYDYPIIFNSLFWLRGAYAAATFMEICIVSFSFVYPKQTLKKLWPFTIVYSIFFTSITLYLLYFTKLWIVEVHTVSFGHIDTIMGTSYIWWVLGEWVLIILSILGLLSNYIKARGLERVQLQYLLIGFFIFGVLVNIPDVILPIFFHTTELFSISSLLGLIFTGTITYIILKHRFLDLERTIRQVGYYSLAILTLGSIYFLITYFVGKLFFPNQFFPVYSFITILIVLVFRYVTTPIREHIGQKIRRSFIKGMYDRQDILQNLNDLTTQTISLKTMVDETLHIAYDTFLPEFVVGLSFSDRSLGILKTYAPKKRKDINLSTEQLQAIHSISTIVISDELPASELKTLLQKSHIAVVVPFHSGRWKRFILLGYKQSGEGYYTYDINTFSLMQPVLRLMGQHVRQVEEIRRFNKKLRQEIDKATTDLRSANKRLKVADKLKDEFISIASHELKTPTTAIQGFLWLVLQKDKQLSTYSRDKIERVAKLTEHMITLVNDMLDVSKIESNRISLYPTFFDIYQLAEEIKGELDLFAFQKHIKITIGPEAAYLVWADRQRMHQVLSNLINNALKYTNNGGKVKISFSRDDDEVLVKVSDNGIGIREEDISKLFTKFGKLNDGNTISSHLPGTGLGLYITKHFIELSGGKIWLESVYGKKTTFYFTLPAINKSK